MKLIDANDLWSDIMMLPHNGDMISSDEVEQAIKDAPAVNPLPCKIGDTVWAVRNFSGTKIAKKGTVSQMYYLDDMRLAIVVNGVARGTWGDKIFATYEEARAAIGGKDNG